MEMKIHKNFRVLIKLPQGSSEATLFLGETKAVKVLKIIVIQSQPSLEARNRNEADTIGRKKDKKNKNQPPMVVNTFNHST